MGEHLINRVHAAAARTKNLQEPGATLKVFWIPGHRDIPSNDKADAKASEAADMALPLPPDVRPVIAEAEERCWSMANQAFSPGRTIRAVGLQNHARIDREFRCFKKRLTTIQTRRKVLWLG